MPDTPKTQSQKFKDKARELGADKNEEAFENTLERIIPKRDKKKGGDRSRREDGK